MLVKIVNHNLVHIDSSLGLIEHCSDSVKNNILNTDIDSNEIIKSMKQLKSSKSSGIDLITNDMLKSSFPIFIEPINKLFNNILHFGIFPNDWNCSLITPILKSESASDPANYRGIAVANSLSKLFLKIITKRIIEHMASNNLWSKNQTGFKNNIRTENNLFIIKTAIHESNIINK